jgi:hypothetical protein
MADDRDKIIAELKAENIILVHAIEELREHFSSIAGTASAVRRLPIRDLAAANKQRNQ